MKVGIILSPYGQKHPSGLSAFVLNLTLALITLKPDWHFILFIRGKQPTPQFDTFENVTIKNIPASFLWKDIACAQNPTIDIWLYTNPSMPLFWKPKKSVLTALDFGTLYKDSKLGIWDTLNLFVAKMLQRDALNKVSHVLCTSYATKKDLHHFFPDIDEAKVTVAMCGFTRICEKYRPASVENLPDEYYLLVGVIKPRKNQLTAVQAFIVAKENGLKGKLLICGSGRDEYFNLLMNTIENASCKDDIRYLGYCSNEQLVTLYKNARALVFPSHVEGFGMPIVEAMSCGTPVIASSNGALGEVANGFALTVDSSDISGFANAMKAMQDDVVRGHYVEKGLERAKEFSWENSARIYAEVLENIAHA